MPTTMDETTAPLPQLPMVVLPLLKGVIDREIDPRLWAQLLTLQAAVGDFVAVLGLELMVDEAEGYAFLRSRDDDGDDDSEAAAKLPRLVARRQLSFPISLLLALLRKKLAEHDAAGGGTRLILSRDEVVEMIRVFLPEGSNEVRLIDQVETYINQIAKMGFLRRLRGQEQMIELHRIIKAFVDAQWLAEFDQRLSEYRARLQPEGARP
ncbi:MAG: DUF4194 domain-containing protein [Mariprofundales bacterium]|nr:DUF4194 domain-containing protein [Mariprofundales bacterium]